MAASSEYSVAVLVMAHNEPELLRLQLERLTQDFDVYVHTDKKAERLLRGSLPSSPRLHVIPSHRTPWGTTDFLRAELELIRTAMARGYDRYVLVSGQCVPLKSNGDIREVLWETRHAEWIGSRRLEPPVDDGFLQRVKRVYWHAPWRYRGIRKALYSIVEYALEFFYRFISHPRVLIGDFYFGETWFALNHQSLKAAVRFGEENADFSAEFRGARLSEELYLQTALRRVVPPATEFLPCISYTDWEKGPETPRVLDMSDYEKMMATSHLFARKFTWAKSRELVERLYQETASKG